MKIKYDNQENEWESCTLDKAKKEHSKSWLKNNTLDNWRHERMLYPINAFINKGDQWLNNWGWKIWN